MILYYNKNIRKRGVDMDNNTVSQDTMKFKLGEEKEYVPAEVLITVYKALVEKGYNPISQMVGYIMSGDPAYITSHNNARSIIKKIERDELLEELVKHYVDTI